MSFYHVKQEHNVAHVNHYFVEAVTLQAAVGEIRFGSHKCHASNSSPNNDFSYEDSKEVERSDFSHQPILAASGSEEGEVGRSYTVLLLLPLAQQDGPPSDWVWQSRVKKVQDAVEAVKVAQEEAAGHGLSISDPDDYEVLAVYEGLRKDVWGN